MTLEILETSVVLVSALNDFNYYYQAKEEKGTNEDQAGFLEVVLCGQDEGILPCPQESLLWHPVMYGPELLVTLSTIDN